jgi:hypothetical protein
VIDTGSPTWQHLKDWAQDQRRKSLDKLCAHGLAGDETEYHRGRIALLKELLTLPEDRPATPPGRPVLLTD